MSKRSINQEQTHSMKLKDRFLKYVSIDTQSDPSSEIFPSTAKQLTLLNLLVEELIQLGVSEVDIDANGYVTGTLPASEGMEHMPTIGFIAHVDTSPDMCGKDVKPQIIENYNGGVIPLGDSGLELSPIKSPELTHYIGHTLITTDGTTLLGADDKAGIAEIMCAAEWLLEHPEVKHGKIRIGFTPDEEIGRGVDYFDVESFGAHFAYTMDGGFEGELEYENFNAAGAKISIQGRNIHPGYAKDKMINALDIGCELNSLIPVHQRPQHTESYEGFYHLAGMSGEVENATLEYIIRDHSSAEFESKKSLLEDIVTLLNKKYGEDVVTLTMKDQYYNMKKMVEPHPYIIELAHNAITEAGITPIIKPIRGGTDGSRLSYMGLPCPNIFTGGMNFHGKYEYCSLTTMQKSVEVIINIAKGVKESI